MNRQELKKIYRLAHLELEESREETLLEKYAKVLSFVEKILEVDTTGVEPMELLAEEMGMRADQVREGISRDRALAAAKSTHYGYFKLKKVVE